MTVTTTARRLLTIGAEEILQDLTTRQFVNPHRPLGDVLADAAGQLGFCDAAAARAVAWLELQPATAVGRLKRTELAQLARCIHRFWRQTAPVAEYAAAPTSPPA